MQQQAAERFARGGFSPPLEGSEWGGLGKPQGDDEVRCVVSKAPGYPVTTATGSWLRTDS